MLSIGTRKIPKQDIVAALPAKGEKGSKSILLLATGETIQTHLSASTLKKHLEGVPLPSFSSAPPET